MVPNPDHYLSVALRTLKDTIIPAIDPGDSFAIEQTQLLVVVLTVLQEQWRYLDLAEERELELQCGLSTELERLSGASTQTCTALVALRAEHAAVEERLTSGTQHLQSLEAMNGTLRAAIDAVMQAVSVSGTADEKVQVIKAARNHARDYAPLGRARYRATRLDPQWETLPTLAQLLGPAPDSEMQD